MEGRWPKGRLFIPVPDKMLCISQFPPDGKLDGKSMKHKAEEHLSHKNKMSALWPRVGLGEKNCRLVLALHNFKSSQNSHYEISKFMVSLSKWTLLIWSKSDTAYDLAAYSNPHNAFTFYGWGDKILHFFTIYLYIRYTIYNHYFNASFTKLGNLEDKHQTLKG